MNDNKIIGATSFTFEGVNWGRIWAAFWTTVAGAILTAITGLIANIDWSHIHVAIFGIDLSQYLPVILTAAWTNVANLVRKWVSNNE